MRLQENEILAIKESYASSFGDGRIYLFGSRVDDSSRGGDIDLFIQTTDHDRLKEKKLAFLVAVKSRIGDQKIDLIISRDKNRIVEHEALEKGIQL